MTSRISYLKREKSAEISELLTLGREIIITVSDCDEGHLTLGSLTLPISGGECRIPPHRLPDGEYYPTLTTEKGQIRLERFCISAGRPIQLPTEEGRIRELLFRVRELELRLSEAEERLSEQEKRISSETIF